MKYTTGFAMLSLCVIIILSIYRKSEPFANPIKGGYMKYLSRPTAPGYFALKKSTLKNNTLRIFYPKGACGKDKTETCGISAVAMYPDNLDNTEATLSADVLFERGFAFDGGKLGLGFEMGTAGATGGRGSKTASSCRVIFKKGGSATCYIYVPLGSVQTDPALQGFSSGKSKYGGEFFETEFPEGTFKAGVKNNVRIGVKMNTPGKANGECFMAINGLTMRKVGITWLTDNVKDGITRLNHTSFIGGNWYSTKDQYVQMSSMTLVDTFPEFKVCGQTEFKYTESECK